MMKNNKSHSKRKEIGKIRLIIRILLLLFNVLFLISCALKDNEKDSTTLVKNEQEKQDINNEGEDQDIDWFKRTNEYWKDFFQEGGQDVEDLYFTIEWLKDKTYFDWLTVDDNGIHCEPYFPDYVKRIQSEEGFDRVEKFLLKTQFDTKNIWNPYKNIYFMHRFFNDDHKGNYVLIYAEDKIKEFDGSDILKEDEKFYRKVRENFYSYIVPYE